PAVARAPPWSVSPADGTRRTGRSTSPGRLPSTSPGLVRRRRGRWGGRRRRAGPGTGGGSALRDRHAYARPDEAVKLTRRGGDPPLRRGSHLRGRALSGESKSGVDLPRCSDPGAPEAWIRRFDALPG